MSLAHGRHLLAIPGPSVIPDRVLQAMHQPAPNIYGGKLEIMTNEIIDDLKQVARTKYHAAIYICNGHGLWEASFANLLASGDKVLSLSSGRFGDGWANVAKVLGADVEMLSWGPRSGLKIDDVHAALAKDKDRQIKMITCTHVDTSSSYRYDIAQIRQVLDDLNHPALLMVDCIASLACDRFEMDAWGVDVMVAASQKGLMTPPGIGVLFFNDKAAAKRADLEGVSPYWDWQLRADPEIFYQRFFGTAPTHHLFGIHEALKMILEEEGLENVWKRHEVLASAVWAAFDHWSKEGVISMNVPEEQLRSVAVTSAKIENRMATPLREWLIDEIGLTLGIGLGMVDPAHPDADCYFRIGHMGHLNAHMLLGTLSSLEAAFMKLDIPFGQGGAAAAANICAGGQESSNT